MPSGSCVVLYGNSVYLAGIKVQLEDDPALELITVETGLQDAIELIRAHQPCALLYDLTMEQSNCPGSLLREQPGLLLVGVDPSSDALLVLSSYPVQALSVADLLALIHPKGSHPSV